ncbi:hypothetical protein ACIQZM_14045 [Peribacillus sp. NPDC097206]|uniref:hypothetical protein n=1 Tax=Peribacillus sp. NPDC097206 TaxID=3364398 RepID=UPI00380B1F75
MQVQKLTASEFIEAGASGFRRLFELEKNAGSFVFFDQNWRRTPFHLILLYPEENNDPSDCYSFSRNDCYEFMVLYLQGMEERRARVWSNSSHGTFEVSYCGRG